MLQEPIIKSVTVTNVGPVKMPPWVPPKLNKVQVVPVKPADGKSVVPLILGGK